MKIVHIICLGLSVMALSACSTIEGMGKDIQSLGKSIEQTASSSEKTASTPTKKEVPKPVEKPTGAVVTPIQ
jgi:predicted small secreted protein